MYIHISIHKMRNMRTEIGQVMPVATAIMRICAFYRHALALRSRIDNKASRPGDDGEG